MTTQRRAEAQRYADENDQERRHSAEPKPNPETGPWYYAGPDGEPRIAPNPATW